ncbi:hypothetical protein [Parablautia sp. Marseille-Q6255]|uniref:hypothetical protein n=1 Tax=Parablautia sp. Marseille-Q6255 TaxID=3039593 RepID=UPI0024BD247C|nr:hypothetical protein [Parablautia sp. Marseille-Q6255]
MRFIKRKPIVKSQIYLKYGFVRTEEKACYCPKCGNILNAGPNYQPKYCSECGQKINFSKMIWGEEKALGYVEGTEHESIKDKVV